MTDWWLAVWIVALGIAAAPLVIYTISAFFDR